MSSHLAGLKSTGYVVAGLVVALLPVGLLPIPSLATPRWEVWVVDENGHPKQGMTVRLSWQNYTLETEGHEEDMRTDQNGYVVFPARTIRASAFTRIAGAIRAAQSGVHASFGPHDYVFAFGQGLQGDAISGRYLVDWTGKPPEMQFRIVVKPMR